MLSRTHHQLVVIGIALLFAPPGVQTQGRSQSVTAVWAGDRFDVTEKSILDLQDAMAKGTITARDLVEIYLARIDAYDRQGPALRAFIALNPRALEEAAALDRERAERGPRGPLHGIPIAVKDNFDVAGLPTTAGSLALATLQPAGDAFQVKRLKAAGAVILGKTNMHELASGITTISSLGGQTRNPYDPARNPGGSSGGTGAAVAANLAAAGLGSDTCGSIRIPASHNALAGLRGSFGLASRDGVLPLSHTQDVAGPLARTVTDLALMLDATVGVDPADDTTRLSEGRIPSSYRESLKADALKGARIGVLRSLFGDSPDDNEAGAIVRRALDAMREGGAEIVDVAVPGLDDLLRGSSVIDAEFKFDLAAYLAAVPGAPASSLGEILDRGLYHQALDGALRRRNAVASPDSDQSWRARLKRQALVQALIAAFDADALDAIAYPTMRRKPALIGDPQSGSTCQLSAATGLPALSVPAGFTRDGLPIGLELLGRPFDEPALLGLAYAFEQRAGVRRPPFSAPPLAGRAAPAPIDFVASIPVREGRKPEGLTVRFSFDAARRTLGYDAVLSGIPPGDVLAAWIHQDQEGGTPGPAVLQILARGETRRGGSFALTAAQQEALAAGRLSLGLYTTTAPAGVRRPLALPAPRRSSP
jgi:Asp-tRNA(Asn)/Glu-tRNA(Gln) amidotransferase A subunit family amidase